MVFAAYITGKCNFGVGTVRHLQLFQRKMTNARGDEHAWNSLSHKRDHIKMRDYMDKWVTPPRRVTSLTWGPPSPCKQALN